MEYENRSCLSNALLVIFLLGLAFGVYFFFGDQLFSFRGGQGGSPIQGILDGLSGFGKSLGDMFSGFSPK